MCEIGSEAVSWMIEELFVQTRQEAVALGQMLLNNGAINHVANKQPFLDDYYFYRFEVSITIQQTDMSI